MKVSFAICAALTFFSLTIGYAIDHEFAPRDALSIRAEFEPERSRPVGVEPLPDTHLDNSPDANKPGAALVAGGVATYRNIKSAITQMRTFPWSRFVITKAQVLQRLVGLHPGFTGDPTILIEVNDLGYGLDHSIHDLSGHVRDLKETRTYSGGRIWRWEGFNQVVTVEDKNGDETLKLVWSTRYYAPKDAVRSFAIYPMIFPSSSSFGSMSMEKRSVPLADLSGSPNAKADPTATFEQYLTLFYAGQATIAAAIAPVLNNITSSSNSTLIHDMANSIYYDLIGSTTLLIGPFNNGMSYLGNASSTAKNMTDFITVVEGIYAGMWMQALTAANGTGILEEMFYIASVLSTNDTSLYPADWTTVKGH